MNVAVWRLTWKLALRRRRLLLWNVAVPALLLVPVVTSAAAATHKAIVVVVLVTFFGAYGSCIPALRDGMSGWGEKVLLAGVSPRRWIMQRGLASSAIDMAELLPVTVALLVLAGADARSGAATLGATGVALVFANLLGLLIASLVRALGEAALGCAVASLFALHASGVFRTPRPGTAWAAVEAWSPLRPLHEMWVSLLGRPESTTVALPPEPLAATILLILLVALVAPRLARRLVYVQRD